MQYAFASLALAALAAAAPQAATTNNGGCAATYPGTFQIQVVNSTRTSKRELFERQSTALMLTLNNGILLDSQGRVGNIVANDQFQFDPAPGQAGAKFTSGWAVCQNGELAINGDTLFYQCLSGTFYNLYDTATAEQCSPITIQVINSSGGGTATAGGSSPAQQMPDGQITGQPGMVSQIADGQIQQATGNVQQIGDGQIQKPTGSPVQQIGDGQVQKPTGAPVSQIADGQIQKPTGSPVQQIGDGQVQKPTGAPVSQIADGQIQKPTGSPVQQIGDGQVQAKNGTSSATAPAQYTGAATVVRAEFFGLAAGVLALAML